MVEKINALLDGIALDYDRDVLPLSEAKRRRRRDRAPSHVRAGKENGCKSRKGASQWWTTSPPSV